MNGIEPCLYIDNLDPCRQSRADLLTSVRLWCSILPMYTLLCEFSVPYLAPPVFRHRTALETASANTMHRCFTSIIRILFLLCREFAHSSQPRSPIMCIHSKVDAAKSQSLNNAGPNILEETCCNMGKQSSCFAETNKILVQHHTYTLARTYLVSDN